MLSYLCIMNPHSFSESVLCSAGLASIPCSSLRNSALGLLKMLFAGVQPTRLPCYNFAIYHSTNLCTSTHSVSSDFTCTTTSLTNVLNTTDSSLSLQPTLAKSSLDVYSPSTTTFWDLSVTQLLIHSARAFLLSHNAGFFITMLYSTKPKVWQTSKSVARTVTYIDQTCNLIRVKSSLLGKTYFS